MAQNSLRRLLRVAVPGIVLASIAPLGFSEAFAAPQPAPPGDGTTAFPDTLADVNALFAAKKNDQAIALLKAHAQKNNKAAQRELGILYLAGNVIPQNLPQGVLWLKKAAA